MGNVEHRSRNGDLLFNLWSAADGERFFLNSESNSPLTKASSALAKASGLAKSQPNPRFGFLVRGLSLVAGLVLALSAYLVYRNQTAGGNSQVLNFVAPLDKLNPWY